MVKEVVSKGKTYYECEECNMFYKSKDVAQKCENFCRENKSCNIEIIKHAVDLDKIENKEGHTCGPNCKGNCNC